MKFCAICTASVPNDCSQEPLGRNDALVNVCQDCTTEPAVEKRGPEVGYPISEGMSLGEMKRRIGKYEKSQGIGYVQPNETIREAQPGWIVVRVRRRNGLGVIRDFHMARDLLRDEPWFKEMRYLGMDATFALFERPPHTTPAVNVEPLAAIEKYRVKS